MFTKNNTTIANFFRNVTALCAMLILPLVVNAQLTITKSVDKTSVLSGEFFTYTLQYRCASTTTDCRNVSVSDVLPAGVYFRESSGSVHTLGSGTFDNMTNKVSFAFVDPLPAGATGQLKIKCYFPNGSTPDGATAVNRATITDGASTVTSNPVTVTAHASDQFCPPYIYSEGPAIGGNTTYITRVPPAIGQYIAAPGILNPTNMTVVQHFAPGVTFVSADNGGVYNAAANTVTWIVPNTAVEIDNRNFNYPTGFEDPILNLNATVSYTNPPFAVGDLTHTSTDITYTPTGTSTPITLVGSGAGSTCEQHLVHDFRLETPVYASDVSKYISNNKPFFYAGERYDYAVSWQNTGNTPLDNFVVEDVFPAGIFCTNIYIPVHGNATGVNYNVYFKSKNNPTYTQLTGGPFAPTNYLSLQMYAAGYGAINMNLAANDTLTGIRLDFGTVPPGFKSYNAYWTFKVKETNTIINRTNCLTATTSSISGVESDCAPIEIHPRPTYAVPSPDKQYTNAENNYSTHYGPDAVGTTFYSRLAMRTYASAPMINPVIMDLLPVGLTYDNYWAMPAQYNTAGLPAPAFEHIVNYNGTGRELLRWRWTGTYTTLDGGVQLFPRLKLTNLAPVDVELINTYALSADNARGCDRTNIYNVLNDLLPDVNDLDGDGSTTDSLCFNSVQTGNIRPSSSAALDSRKLVKGQIDTDYSAYPAFGQTVPGGLADYKLTVRNIGNIPMTNVQVVDILPFVGDMGVIDLSGRGSQWRPNLVAPVAAPSGVTVYYSTASNPCRSAEGIEPSGPAGCVAPNWSTTPPLDITDVQSIKFDFGVIKVNPGDELNLTWPMRAPINAPTNGEVAWNSFGYIANQVNPDGTTGSTLLPSEPIKVGIKVNPITPAVYGNFVWLDTNRNGVQDAGEAGIDGVRVELYKDNGDGINDPATDTLKTFTLTTLNGQYIFPNLPPGDYYAVMYLPTNYDTSPANQGTDDTKDSDGTAANLNGFNVIKMPVTNLMWNEYDYTWDQGIYPNDKASVGNYVWFDEDNNGIQNEPASDGLNGVTVQIYAAGNTTTPIATQVTHNDANGFPGYYLFDNLPPGDYQIKVTPPAGATFSTGAGYTPSTTSDGNDSDVSATGWTSTITLAPNQTDLNWDAGIQMPTGNLSLGNMVWNDTDNSGTFDSGETGINGVTVNLYRDSNNDGIPQPNEYIGSDITHTMAGANGFYLFTNLITANYIVQIAPSNFTPSGALSGLLTSTGNDVAGAATDPDNNINNDDNGTYNGTYGVISAPISLVAFTEPTNDGDGNQGNLTVDFGFRTPPAPASIGDRVWLDADKNGIQDANEVGVAGITVTLYDNTGKAVSATKTDAYGNYLFSGLTPGNYTVGFTLPSNYVFTTQGTGTDSGTATDSDVLPSNGGAGGGSTSGTFGLTKTITLGAGENERNVDAGIYFSNKAAASIGDYVWFDTNADGIQDAAEKGIAGVTVTLYNGAGVPVATTITDGTGHYLFDNVTPGTYSVGFAAQPGLVLTAPTNGTTDGSDAIPASGKTPTFTVAAGEQRRDIDAGFKTVSDPANSAAVGDYVWNDLNNDGIQNANEAGIAGVTVTLYSADGTTVIATTVTDAFGRYLFNDLTPDAYRIQFTAPTGFVVVAKDAGGNDSKDSDANATTGMTNVFTLAPGEKNLTVDCGLYNASLPTGSIGDYVWNDANKDGIQDANEGGVAGVTVMLTDGTTTWTTTTDANGKYLFSNLPAGNYTVTFSNIPEGYVFTQQTDGTNNGSDVNSTGVSNTINLAAGERKTDIDAGIFPAGTSSGTASIGNYVWYDTDNNGKQDAGETAGVPGVTVILYAADGTTVLATQKTDATGHYLFTGLNPGTYIVGFAPSSLPAGYAFAPANATGTGFTDNNDSDADATTGKTAPITVAAGEENTSVDAGIWKANNNLGSIGNFVWNDLNGDGKQDTGELGAAGVSVTLIDKVTGAIVKTTITDSNGAYLFADLPYGSYNVVFGNLPSGFTFSPKDATNDSIDSDADPVTGKTGDIVLDATNPNNTTTDAGIHTTTKAGLGDYVWEDANGDGIQNANEKGIAGVLVTLLDGAGTPIATAVTDENGYYAFINLTPGSYQLTFTNLPEGSSFTKQGQGTAATDSDADATGKTALITLAAGEFNNTIDAGVVVQKAGLGDYVWYDTDGNGVQNPTETGVAGVTVTLYDATTNLPLARTVTDGNGFYQFVNLLPATYYVVFEPTTLPANSGFTNQTVGTSNGSDANATTGRTPNVTLAPGEYNSSIDAGIIPTAALGDFVWLDTNKNGVQDVGESGLGGVTVNLYLASNPRVIFRTVTTRSSGAYLFTNLPADDYIVEFAPVTGYTRTTGTNGGDDNSDADALTGRTGIITLAAGERNPNIDAGYYVTPLPVSLLYFKGAAENCTVLLNWATASEQNAKSFRVERSADGKTWGSLGIVAAAGNSVTVRNYQFTDSKPKRTNYYRLVQADFDGQTAVYGLAQSVETQGCFDETTNGVTNLYPNPNNTEEVTVKFYTDRGDEEAAIEIYDVLGQQMSAMKLPITNGVNLVNMDISDLASGTYLIKIVGAGWYSVAQKLVRVKE